MVLLELFSGIGGFSKGLDAAGFTFVNSVKMKKMFETIFILGLTLTGVLCLVACNSTLSVQQVYEFDMATLPVQNKIVAGEEAEIRCELIREGVYQETEYYIRYFQPEGKGQLRLEDGTVLLPNDLYPLEKEKFRLYYKSLSTDQQTINIYIVDSHGQTIQKTFSFNNESQDKEKEG